MYFQKHIPVVGADTPSSYQNEDSIILSAILTEALEIWLILDWNSSVYLRIQQIIFWFSAEDDKPNAVEDKYFVDSCQRGFSLGSHSTHMWRYFGYSYSLNSWLRCSIGEEKEMKTSLSALTKNYEGVLSLLLYFSNIIICRGYGAANGTEWNPNSLKTHPHVWIDNRFPSVIHALLFNDYHFAHLVPFCLVHKSVYCWGRMAGRL